MRLPVARPALLAFRWVAGRVKEKRATQDDLETERDLKLVKRCWKDTIELTEDHEKWKVLTNSCVGRHGSPWVWVWMAQMGEHFSFLRLSSQHLFLIKEVHFLALGDLSSLKGCRGSSIFLQHSLLFLPYLSLCSLFSLRSDAFIFLPSPVHSPPLSLYLCILPCSAAAFLQQTDRCSSVSVSRVK